MTRQEFKRLVADKIVILDGATGTELAKRGMPAGVCPELWVTEHPEAIIAVQQEYCAAGADIVYVPSFGGNRCKLTEFGLADRLHELNRALALLSRRAVGDRLAFGDLAPTGQFVFPIGELPFEEAVNIYKEQVRALLDGGVDGFVIETMMDLQEARAALLAVRESCDLPVMVTMTFNEDGRSLTGNDPISALVALQALGADAFGCNCSTGPRNMIEIIRGIKPYARIPLIAKPNAGMPRLIDGKTVFGMGPEEFGSFAPAFAAAGINLLGGCCGSTPEHIRCQAALAGQHAPLPPQPAVRGAVCSARKTRLLAADRPFAVIGERINPTGKKALQAELREGKLNLVRKFAAEQTEQGAALLDVNMGLSGIDEKEMMVKTLAMLVPAFDTPLCFDSTDPEVMEAALRLYPGRALVNSVSAEKERIEKMLPTAAKYGAMLILLPLTDAGIPATAAERIETVKYLCDKAAEYGYEKADLCVDALIMTISSNQAAAGVSLELIEWCSREFGINTVCGLSNVSFGMPQRPLLNATFLGMAIGRGLNMAIANPATQEITDLVAASDALNGRDRKMSAFVGRYSGAAATAAAVAAPGREISPEQRVFDCVMRGDEEAIAAAIEAALNGGFTPQQLVDEALIPAINRVGEKFEKKEYFLPQLIMSADAMRRGFAVLEPLLQHDGADAGSRPRIVLATVKGDIHDIGKNIVGLMLRNYGFEVFDLGKDVPAETILDAAVAHRVDLIGLSALMTTTMTAMKEVIALAKDRRLDNLRFIVGGAVVDQAYADEIGAHYAKDALDAVRVATKLLP
ncbi:MAG: homocysteine S-methyltransferase family protein [Victivallales bacterium]|nr:homocysteine S-methyltransferase family protein [Victivallales bacterium]